MVAAGQHDLVAATPLTPDGGDVTASDRRAARAERRERRRRRRQTVQASEGRGGGEMHTAGPVKRIQV